MKQALYPLLLVSCLAFFSCKKPKQTVVTLPGQLSLLQDVPIAIMPANDIDGSLQVVKQEFVHIQGIDTTIRKHEIAYANFLSSQHHTFGDAGTVSLNGIAVARTTYPGGDSVYYYTMLYDTATPNTFHPDSNALWSVTGSGYIPAFSYSDTATFPGYKGHLPISVSKAAGLTLTIDATTVYGADSVFIIIADSINNLVYKNVPAGAGAVTFTPSELLALHTTSGSATMPAWLKVFPYRYTVQQIGGKQFAFVKEKETWQVISIQ